MDPDVVRLSASAPGGSTPIQGLIKRQTGCRDYELYTALYQASNDPVVAVRKYFEL